MLQQYLPLAVLKLVISSKKNLPNRALQQYLPLAVCDEGCEAAEEQSDDEVRTSLVPDRREGKTKVMKQQCLPLAVLKHFKNEGRFVYIFPVATVLTACGIETLLYHLPTIN